MGAPLRFDYAYYPYSTTANNNGNKDPIDDTEANAALTDGMTPFDVLSSVFGSSLAPSELEEALAASGYDFDRAMAWLIDRVLPSHNPLLPLRPGFSSWEIASLSFPAILGRPHLSVEIVEAVITVIIATPSVAVCQDTSIVAHLKVVTGLQILYCRRVPQGRLQVQVGF